MKRQRLALVLSFSLLLGGCETTALLDSIADLNPFGEAKTKLPGERKPVFPEGVPGVSQGVPPELMKGAQPQDPLATPPPEAAAPQPPPEPQKPKPQPKAQKQARPKQQAPQQSQPARPAVAPHEAPWQPPPQEPAPWPQQSQQSPSSWPAPPPPQRVQ